MDTVPTKILHEILSYLPKRDLGSVRLLNHSFNTAANGRYFRTIRVPSINSTIDILAHISRQPHAAQSVRHLIYPYRRKGSSLPWGEEAGYDQSQDAVPQEIHDILKFALSKMPNIREITVNLDARNCKTDRQWPETSIIKDHRNFYIRKLTNSNKQLMAQAFYELLAGASQAQTRLEKLTIHSIWRGILKDEVNVVWKYTPLFQNLASLTVLFCTVGNSLDYKCMWDDVYEGRVFKFLSLAPKLKMLSLGLDWKDPRIISDVWPVTPLAKIFGDSYVWKHLEAFYFNHGHRSMHAEELMHFWARHSTTLKIFGLHKPRLETGSWREVFDFIKEQPEL
ncbi:hypothetical protein RUND412_011478, partial [Rhizina undulata]